MILREGLRALLSLEPDFDVIGEAESVSEGQLLATQMQPNLVITDIGLHGQSGLNIIPFLKTTLPGVRVLVLTAHCTDEYVRAALEVGADGYILKDASRADLLRAIRAIFDGKHYFSSAVTERVVAGFLGKRNRDHGDVLISERERQVMTLVAMAYSTKRIATHLSLSIKTVEKHRANLMRKLDLRNTAAVTLYAVRHNLVPVDVIGQPTIAGTDVSEDS